MNTFKDKMGRWRSLSMFWENRHPDYDPIFTLKEEDHKGLPSLYRLYMETEDPTEFKFAEAHLGGWTHWKSFKDAKWFKPHIEAWRAELKVRMESKRYHEMKRVQSEAEYNSPQYIQATKWLAERYGEAPAKPVKRGRPSKDEVKGHLKQEAQELSALDADAKSIGLIN